MASSNVALLILLHYTAGLRVELCLLGIAVLVSAFLCLVAYFMNMIWYLDT